MKIEVQGKAIKVRLIQELLMAKSHAFNFHFGFSDEENDLITISDDDDLAEAAASFSGSGLLRLLVSKPKQSAAGPQAEGPLHPRVTCDSCQAPVRGWRFKCLECSNFDLCALCHAAGAHAHHDMLCLRRPHRGVLR